MRIDNWRWAGTPFYLRTGKRLPKRVTEVAIQFKRVPHLSFSYAAAEQLENNELVLRIQPNEGIQLRFGAKVPSPRVQIRTVNMDFEYDTSFSSAPAEAYETLLLDAMRGDSTNFPRQDAVEQLVEDRGAAGRRLGARRRRDAPVPGRHVGPRGGRRAARARPPALAAAVTTVGAIERRLADLRHEAAGEHRGARTNVVELVVWAGNDDLADEAADAIAGLTHNRPSRALVLEPAPLQHVASDESVFCALPPDGGGGVLVCSEVVRLRGPADTEALPSMARSLMLPNLPLFVLWLDEPRFDGPIAKGILRGATRLVVDSTRFPAVLPAAAGPGRGRAAVHRRPVVDEDHGLAGRRGAALRPARAP